jgi:hypothetical protein
VKKIFLILFLLPIFSKAQFVFQNSLGTPKYAAITVLYDQVHHEKSLLYFSSYQFGNALITLQKDTTVSGVRLCRIAITGDNSVYYIVFDDGLSKISWYDNKLNLICDLTNDSHYYNINYVPKQPTISTDGVLMLLKLLLL